MEAGNKVDRANPLFDKIIPVKIVNGPEIDSNALVCRLLMRYRTTSGGQVNRSYRLELTSNTNHQFIYFTEIPVDDFPTFQKERELNCDFAAFAVYVVKLLNDVIKTHRSIKNASCGENEDESYVDLPDSLIAEFDYASHTFTFLQNSAMKVTRFLYFNLTLADDNATKEYLSGRLQLALDNGEKYLKQNCASDVAFQEQLERYRELEEKLKQKDAERVKQNESFNEEKSEIIMNFTTKLSTMQVDTEKMMLQQRKDLSNEIDSLKAKNNELETINDELTNDLREVTADKRTLQRQYDGISADLERIQKTCDDLSNAKNNAEAGYMNRDAEVTRMKFTIQKLEQDVDNKTELLKSVKALQLKSEENCKKYLDDITNIQHANEQLQKHVMTNNKEIKKGNDNITQLLMNINQLKEKLNNKNNIIKTQENVIHTLKQQHIEQLDKQNETNSKLTNLTTVNENLENEIKLLKQKLSDAIDKVEQQDNALKYMHQTLDEQLLYGGGLGVGFNGIGIHSDGNGDQHTHSIPAGMGLYTGSGVMTLTNMSAGHDGSSSPNSITKQTSPARQHSNEQNMKNRVQMKQTTSAFLEKYGKQNQDRVLEHPPQDWNEHASIVSHGNSTGGNKAHATPDMLTNIALVTPDVIDSTHATNQSNNISTVPTSYIKKNITYPVSSSMSSQQSSDLSTNTDMILNKVNETDLLSKIGIDYHDYQKHTGYNEVESDEEDDDMNALLYYKTTI